VAFIYCGAILLVLAGFTALNVLPLNAANRDLRTSQENQRLLAKTSELSGTLSAFQLLIEQNLMASGDTLGILSAKAAEMSQAITTDVQLLVKAAPGTPLEPSAAALQRAGAAFTKGITELAIMRSGKPLADERASYTQLLKLTAEATGALQTSNNPVQQSGVRRVHTAEVLALVLWSTIAVGLILSALIFGRLAARRERREHLDQRRQTFTTTLHEALDMSKAESEVYGVVRKALDQSLPTFSVEMLLADSSRAHFHRALGTPGSENRTGCDVVAPRDCPAITRGHTLVFSTSTALNSCPHLQDRASGDCSAACVPISIAGKNVGVTHATGPVDAPPTDDDLRYLEITSRRASERIAMLRAFEKSETQAQSDPLTGLLNRRSLESRVRDLQRDGISYSVAYGDLDHFKMLNDTHGHETGDQALRLFSRVLRDSLRPTDIASRYGGEEFVILLPNCDPQTAVVALERVRENLALALTSGRIPGYTVSFGVADSRAADTFNDVVKLADQALLSAKRAGRNRTLTAGQVEHDPLPDAASTPSSSPGGR
jgi:diguanylate cyclase (GGDEF)-like protein